MNKQSAHPQKLRPLKRVMKQYVAVVWLFMRSFFWIKRWFRWAREMFPDPNQSSDELFSRMHSFTISFLFILAYTLYGGQQLQTLDDFISNFLHSFSWTSLANTAAFIILLYIIFAYQMRIRGKHFWQPLGYIFLPLSMTVTLFFGAFLFFQYSGTDANNLTTIGSLIWAAVLISMISSLVGFIYTVYRAVKTRMNTPTMHPVIGPLIELALSLKALVIASQGQALIFWLPYIPSRLLALLPSAIVIIFYTRRAIKVQRAYMKHRQTDFPIEIRKLWKQISNTRRPAKNRLKDLWEFRKTQTFSFGICILLLAIALFLPSGMMQAQIFPEALP